MQILFVFNPMELDHTGTAGVSIHIGCMMIDRIISISLRLKRAHACIVTCFPVGIRSSCLGGNLSSAIPQLSYESRKSTERSWIRRLLQIYKELIWLVSKLLRELADAARRYPLKDDGFLYSHHLRVKQYCTLEGIKC